MKNDIKRKGIVVQKTYESEGNEKWVQEEEDQENKKIKQNEGWQKRWKKTLIKEKHKKSKNILFFFMRKSFKQKDNKGDKTK